MDAFELFLVGRRLMKIAQDAMPAVGADELPASVRSVMVDVFAHPDSSVGEIAARTGFPQSHVSASIARLREAGVLVTAVDLADRRRLLIRRSPDTRPDHPAPVDDAVAEALGTDEHLQPVLAALETLARHLNR